MCSFCYICFVCITTLETFLLQGEPFMESLFNNKPMLYSISVSGSAIIALASGLMPEANEYFELVQLPDNVSTIIVQVANGRYFTQVPRFVNAHLFVSVIINTSGLLSLFITVYKLQVKVAFLKKNVILGLARIQLVICEC